ncbi:MAG: phosphatase PAP2 family protein [Chloroflexota bacterium]|nr:phosphatase PAP2 family protein [Chloroflexota bacterium]MDE2894652.1 phosphatase PAP2 family protein [Chloroflexota bacterium]
MREFLRELAAVAAAALVYYLVRGAVSDRADEAFQRARDILNLEQRLWLDWELAIHEAILGSNALIDVANGTYFWGHMPLLIVIAVWLWRSHRTIWRTFRNALLVSAAVGMVCYYLFPTAPPRLMPGLGYIDTLAFRAAPAYQAQEVGLFVNPYAALPSLHVGWALLAGLAVWQTSRHPLMRAFAVAIPLSQSWAVVATANHWTLDAFAGIGVCAIAWGVVVLSRRLSFRMPIQFDRG